MTLWPHGPQHARPPCTSPSSGVHPSSCSLNQWCYSTISYSATLFFFCLQSFPASGSFPHLQFSCSVVSDSLRLHGLQHARLPCPSPTPRVYPNSYPLSWWCHPTISFSDIPFSSCLQSFPASGSFLISQFFASGGQSIGAGASASSSASVLPVNI